MMGNKFIWSDLHLGHNNLAKYRKLSRVHNDNGFVYEKPYTSEEQNELSLEQLKKLNKKDICFMLGDVVFSDYWLQRLREARCRKILFGGNHDIDLRHIVKSEVFESVRAFGTHKGCWVGHCPVHDMELRGRISVHGHTHYQLMLDMDSDVDPRYRNVCLEYTRYKPIQWEYAISEEYLQECTKLYYDSYQDMII